uniref:Uncharacterized protein n=1 Tax=Arundo donax TaxID=35708 RepID=A0A0A8YT99_ARUDO
MSRLSLGWDAGSSRRESTQKRRLRVMEQTGAEALLIVR